jgi:hypothetical protein
LDCKYYLLFISDVRLRKFLEERNELQDQVRHLKLELEEERSRNSKADRRASGSLFTLNGPDGPEMLDVQRKLLTQLFFLHIY